MDDVMNRCQRIDPPLAGTERELLGAFLDWHRQTLLCKLDGVSEEDLRRAPTASSISLLGLVKHLTAVEKCWFRERFAGEEIPPVFDGGNAAGYWQIGPNETTENLIAAYLGETARSREIVGRHDFDDLAKRPKPAQAGLTLRWVMLHMLEETARHVGHADLIREAIDGQVGE